MTLLKVKEVAERLRVAQTTVYALINSGRLAHHAIGCGQGGKRVSEEQLADYLRSTERGGGPAEEKHKRTIKPKLKHLVVP